MLPILLAGRPGLVVIIANSAKKGNRMNIYLDAGDVLDHMFNACTTSQINEFIPEKRGFRIHGHSTTISLERAFWSVLEDMARDANQPLARLIERVHDGCLVANDKNIASCLRVICLKYLNIYSGGTPAARAELTRAA
jgi:predicted DNA-binding ribbon-helix-helix protein